MASKNIVWNVMKNIGYCIKLHLPLVLMISATLYWNPLTMVRTYLPKLCAPITTDHNWLAPHFIIINITIVIVSTIAVNFLIHRKDTIIIISTDLGQCYAWRGTAGIEAIIHCQRSPSSNISLLMVHTLRVTISSLCHFCLLLCQSWGIPDSSIWSISCFLSQTILGSCWNDLRSLNRKTQSQSHSESNVTWTSKCTLWRQLSDWPPVRTGRLFPLCLGLWSLAATSQSYCQQTRPGYTLWPDTHHIFSIKTTCTSLSLNHLQNFKLENVETFIHPNSFVHACLHLCFSRMQTHHLDQAIRGGFCWAERVYAIDSILNWWTETKCMFRKYLKKITTFSQK